MEGIFGGGGFPAENVDDIAQTLEGEKGDADGQGYGRYRNLKTQTDQVLRQEKIGRASGRDRVSAVV